MPKQAPYRWLAKYYDLVFGEFHAPLRQSRPAISSCGRGTAALKLTRLGIRKYGADLSPGRCREARGSSVG